MKCEKINNYKLTGSIHTLQIKSMDIPDVPPQLQECISSSSTKTKKIENEKKSKLEDIEREFVTDWSNRWQKAIATANVEAVWSKFNCELAKIYQEDKTAYPVKFRSLTDFLIQYQDCIFCHRQMVQLLEMIGIENPESRARNHKKRYGIEYFSKTDLKKAVAEIKRATCEFFSE